MSKVKWTRWMEIIVYKRGQPYLKNVPVHISDYCYPEGAEDLVS